MRKILIAATFVAAGIAAAPASAQVYGQPYGGNYGAPYGNAYGYNNYGQQQRMLQVRLHQIRSDIRRFDRNDALSRKEARRLDQQAQRLQMRIQRAGWDGIDPYERQRIEMDIAQLQRHVARELADGNRRYGNRYGYGYGNERGYRSDGMGQRRYDRERERDHDRDDDRDHDRHEGRDRD